MPSQTYAAKDLTLAVLSLVDRVPVASLVWYLVMRMTFVLPAPQMGVLDRISFAAHREH